MKKFYLTTTLPYVNAAPHIGFALEMVQADIIARHRRAMGDEVVFNTGTDEHGQKIYEKAVEEKKDPQEYVDEYAAKFDRLKEALNLTYTTFTRTTDPHHIAAAQEFWRRCAKNGDIEKKLYAIKYCVGCELEKTDSELENGVCPFHPNLKIEELKEENYFFKFSKYGERLLQLYEQQKDFVVPDARQNEIKSFVAAGLHDFSISRLKKKLPWGVSVPGDDTHVMYVWFDALVNYVSALGWPESEQAEGGTPARFVEWWGTAESPNALQLAGKDNLRQQSAMWQAMLMSAGLPPSRQIMIHGFITADGQKMSKSLGNAVDPFLLVDTYGTDALRYWLSREISPFEDGDFSTDKFKERYNADLANGLGNIIARIAALGEKCGPVAVKDAARHGDAPLPQDYNETMSRYRFKDILERIWRELSVMDKYINEQKLWEQEPKIMGLGVAACAFALLYHARLLEPFLPGTVEKIRQTFVVDGDMLTIKKGAPLFPRIA